MPLDINSLFLICHMIKLYLSQYSPPRSCSFIMRSTTKLTSLTIIKPSSSAA
ncbi:hypothetical protein KSP39_PZI024245 [Platanthera zijinensis]|uniref:Uncharacterized protein n=1 Tax=Platanthera zijinensis TaxID=2320716 RepID=A0AAP0ASP0_9ASPA